MSKLNPAQTIIVPPADIAWKVPDAAPPNSVAEASLGGGEDQAGAYLLLMKWWPGWMSAPHTYLTDRLCVVLSGVWWCNSGPDFDPAQAVPVHPAGATAVVIKPLLLFDRREDRLESWHESN